MNDDSPNQLENQTINQPIFQSVPIEEGSENLTPEEIKPEIEAPAIEENIEPLGVDGNNNNFNNNSNHSPPPLGIFSSNNKNKLFILLSVAIGGLIILLVLIKLFSSPPAKNIQLVYWGLWEEKEVYDPLIAEFEQKNPTIKISYQKMYHQDYLNKLLTRSRDNKGPDIFRFHNTWLPLLKEIAAPLPKNIMSNSEFEKTFYPIHQSDLKIGNYYYGLPLEIDGLVLICNQDMFNKAGMETNVVSLDDFMDAAKKLTTKTRSGQLITSGVALGLAGNIEHFSDTLGLMFLQNGVEYKVNTTKGSDSLENYLKFAAGLTSQEAAGALETYRKFAEQPNALWDDSMPNSIEAFIQEKVAMIIAPSWEVITIKNSKPELKIKVLPIYTVPGNKPISIANYWVEGVSKKSRNQTAAWLFLRFLIEKENLIKLYENQAKLRLFGEPYSRVDLADKLIQNEYVGAVIKQANNFVSLPVVSRVFDNNFNDEIVKYLENAVNSTVNGGSYTEAMKTAQAGITQVLEKIK